MQNLHQMHCKALLEACNSRTEKPSSRGARQCLSPNPTRYFKTATNSSIATAINSQQKCSASIAASLNPKHHSIPQSNASPPQQNAYNFSPRVPASRRENKATSKHICYLGPLTSAPPFPFPPTSSFNLLQTSSSQRQAPPILVWDFAADGDA